MPTIVCHGLQSHLESQLVDTTRTMRLKLPSSKPLPSPPPPPQSIDLAFKSCFWDSNIKTQHDNEVKNDTNNNMSGWSFLEALSNVSQATKGPSKQIEEEATYVHPQQKRSSMALSPRSLELCTENLGNESGTDIVENDVEMLSSLGTSQEKMREQPRQNWTAKKARTANFPPPLTTIRGSGSLRVRPHREDGRLVIEITKVPPSASCFQAERSHGRLRLCFLNNQDPSFDPEEGEDDDVDVVGENEATANEEGFSEVFGNDFIGQLQDIVEIDEEEEKETKEVKTGERKTKGEETEDEKGEIGCGCDRRMERLEIEMPRRCNEGGDHHHENNESLLVNWGKPFWVATS